VPNGIWLENDWNWQTVWVSLNSNLYLACNTYVYLHMMDHIFFVQIMNKKCISHLTTSHFHFTLASTSCLSFTHSFVRPGRCVGNTVATAAEWLCTVGCISLDFLLFCVLLMLGLGVLIPKTEATVSFGTSLLPNANSLVVLPLLDCCKLFGT
jgi:hypothetical protein